MLSKFPFLQKLILPGILIFSFVFGFLIAYIGSSLVAISKKPITAAKTTSFAKATPAPINDHNPEKGIYNLLTLGYGGANHDGGLLTDSIIVLHVDTNTHKATMISIPRDLWVPGNHKVNAASVAGFKDSGPAIQNVTGLPINYFVAVDFGGFTKLIDNLGGITVNVPVGFDDPFYPITGQENNTCGFTNDQINDFKNRFQGFQLESQFTCRYEHLHFDKGNTNLDGATALKFVRSRHGDSDFGRSLRQFAVLQGIGNKLVSLRSVNKLDDTINTLFQIVHTDLDLGTIKSLTQVFGDPGLYKINQIELSTDNVLTQGFASDGEYILTPKSGDFNFQGIKDYINSQLQK